MRHLYRFDIGGDFTVSLTHGQFVMTSGNYLYVGDSNNLPVEVVTMAHELNIGTINGMTVENILDMMVSKGIGIGGDGSADAPIIEGSLELGSKVKMGGYTWLVCHVGVSAAYLILDVITTDVNVTFESGVPIHEQSYKTSTLPTACLQFFNLLPINVQTFLLSVSVNDIMEKIFIPTLGQLLGGFGLFSTPENRIAYNYNGDAAEYVTSNIRYDNSIYNTEVIFITSTGEYSLNGRTGNHGFRPACMVPLA